VPDAGPDPKKLQEMLNKQEQDIRNIKSTFQRQISEQQRKWDEERKQLQDDLRRAQMASLDDDEKVEFQKNLELERASDWQQRAMDAEQRLQESQALQNYTQFFVEQGVPVSQLIRDQGLDALVNSGWTGVQLLIRDLQNKLKTLETPAPAPVTPATTTPVRTPISATPAPAGGGPTWDDLIKRYGSAEEVYKLVEEQVLPPSIIPLT